MADETLLVLADEQDVAARTFVDRYRGEGARLLSPADLSCAGWRYLVGHPVDSVAIAGGLAYPAATLRGVITRLPSIGRWHLPHVADADRDYVASEMNAFLVAWLSALPCPVLNRPVLPSLSGPGWAWDQWVQLALALGVPVAPSRRSVRPGQPASMQASIPHGSVRIDIIGPAVVGHGDARLAVHARRLAEGAGVSLLGVQFDADHGDARLVGVDPWPNLSEPEIGAALMACLP